MAEPIVVAALYQFFRFPDYTAYRAPLLRVMLRNGVRGTLLLASEGINGTVAGSRAGIHQLHQWLLAEIPGVDTRLSYKESLAEEMPFLRSKVKLKREIVTMGVAEVDPQQIVGTYVAPQDWNRLLQDPEVTVIDTRNDYEVAIGTFQGAHNPDTQTFRDFPEYAAKNLDPKRHKKIAMFCTGGIRCEKSTAYLKQQGFEEVYHLQGGILKYLEEVPPEQSLWQGECFVFDQRVSVRHGLEPGEYDQCHACRRPISAADKQHPAYEHGVSCPHCIDSKGEADRARYRERERQMQLAEARGQAHLGHGGQDSA